MSYALSPHLQAAIFQVLAADATLAGLVGTAIFDGAPDGPPPALYVSVGAELVRDKSDQTGAGAAHDLEIAVIATEPRFLAAKEAAAAICDALAAPPPTLARGRIVALNFTRARAQSLQAGRMRRIDLRFRARVEDD